MRMGPRMSRGNTEPRIGPTPFSAEWIDDPPAPERPRRVPVGKVWLPASLPAWLPSERLVSAVLVLVIILGTAAFSSGAAPGRQLPAPDLAGQGTDVTDLVQDQTDGPVPADQSGSDEVAATGSETSDEAVADAGTGSGAAPAAGTDGTDGTDGPGGLLGARG